MPRQGDGIVAQEHHSLGHRHLPKFLDRPSAVDQTNHLRGQANSSHIVTPAVTHLTAGIAPPAAIEFLVAGKAGSAARICTHPILHQTMRTIHHHQTLRHHPQQSGTQQIGLHAHIGKTDDGTYRIPIGTAGGLAIADLAHHDRMRIVAQILVSASTKVYSLTGEICTCPTPSIAVFRRSKVG